MLKSILLNALSFQKQSQNLYTPQTTRISPQLAIGGFPKHPIEVPRFLDRIYDNPAPGTDYLLLFLDSLSNRHVDLFSQEEYWDEDYTTTPAKNSNELTVTKNHQSKTISVHLFDTADEAPHYLTPESVKLLQRIVPELAAEQAKATICCNAGLGRSGMGLLMLSLALDAAKIFQNSVDNIVTKIAAKLTELREHRAGIVRTKAQYLAAIVGAIQISTAPMMCPLQQEIQAAGGAKALVESILPPPSPILNLPNTIWDNIPQRVPHSTVSSHTRYNGAPLLDPQLILKIPPLNLRPRLPFSSLFSRKRILEGAKEESAPKRRKLDLEISQTHPKHHDHKSLEEPRLE